MSGEVIKRCKVCKCRYFRVEILIDSNTFNDKELIEDFKNQDITCARCGEESTDGLEYLIEELRIGDHVRVDKNLTSNSRYRDFLESLPTLATIEEIRNYKIKLRGIEGFIAARYFNKVPRRY